MKGNIVVSGSVIFDGPEIIKVNNWSDYKKNDDSLVYDWPYTDQCPRCHKRTMLGDKCSNCDFSGHQSQCPRCHKWMHHEYVDGRTQCTLYCDPEDKRLEEEKELVRYYIDYQDVSTYPVEVRKLAETMLKEHVNITFDMRKDEFIELLQKLRSAILE
jgi:hypothetical protein